MLNFIIALVVAMVGSFLVFLLSDAMLALKVCLGLAIVLRVSMWYLENEQALDQSDTHTG